MSIDAPPAEAGTGSDHQIDDNHVNNADRANCLWQRTEIGYLIARICAGYEITMIATILQRTPGACREELRGLLAGEIDCPPSHRAQLDQLRRRQPPAPRPRRASARQQEREQYITLSQALGRIADSQDKLLRIARYNAAAAIIDERINRGEMYHVLGHADFQAINDMIRRLTALRERMAGLADANEPAAAAPIDELAAAVEARRADEIAAAACTYAAAGEVIGPIPIVLTGPGGCFLGGFSGEA